MLLRIDQVTSELALSRRQVYRLIAEGRLAAVDVGRGRGRRVIAEDLAKFCQVNRVVPGAAKSAERKGGRK